MTFLGLSQFDSDFSTQFLHVGNDFPKRGGGFHWSRPRDAERKNPDFTSQCG
jgi:hypothetical protein